MGNDAAVRPLQTLQASNAKRRRRPPQCTPQNPERNRGFITGVRSPPRQRRDPSWDTAGKASTAGIGNRVGSKKRKAHHDQAAGCVLHVLYLRVSGKSAGAETVFSISMFKFRWPHFSQVNSGGHN